MQCRTDLVGRYQGVDQKLRDSSHVFTYPAFTQNLSIVQSDGPELLSETSLTKGLDLACAKVL